MKELIILQTDIGKSVKEFKDNERVFVDIVKLFLMTGKQLRLLTSPFFKRVWFEGGNYYYRNYNFHYLGEPNLIEDIESFILGYKKHVISAIDDYFFFKELRELRGD